MTEEEHGTEAGYRYRLWHAVGARGGGGRSGRRDNCSGQEIRLKIIARNSIRETHKTVSSENALGFCPKKRLKYRPVVFSRPVFLYAFLFHWC